MDDLGLLCAPERTWKPIRIGHRGLPRLASERVPIAKAHSCRNLASAARTRRAAHRNEHHVSRQETCLTRVVRKRRRRPSVSGFMLVLFCAYLLTGQPIEPNQLTSLYTRL